MSPHPPVRLRLTLAFLVLAVAGTAIGGALLLGSGQDDPTESADTQQLAVTGPPLVPEVETATDWSVPGQDDPEMRLGVLDKDEARREERQARADARALRALAAQQAAAYEYAAAIADDQVADAAAVADLAPTGPPATPEPPPTTAPPADPGGGGGNQPPPTVPNHNNDPLYTKLDNIATCESNQNPQAVSPDRNYWGAFQFLFETWKSYGGGGSRPRDIITYSYGQQREIAANLAQARGFAGSWPTCAARYGYT